VPTRAAVCLKFVEVKIRGAPISQVVDYRLIGLGNQPITN